MLSFIAQNLANGLRYLTVTPSDSPRRWQTELRKIAVLESELENLTNEELRRRSLALRYRAMSGESLACIRPDAYALVREASRRTLGMRHYDVQIAGGIAMSKDAIAEMHTGEGKSLTATLPMYLHALHKKGAHLATVNDYLAKRDAELMRPVFELLGMTVGVVTSEMESPQRRKAYRCDITYGTAREFAFDFLRDRLQKREIVRSKTGLASAQLDMVTDDSLMQRDLHFVLIDEADSILIDEARTPFIISAAPSERDRAAVTAYQWSSRVDRQFIEGTHYKYDDDKRSVELNATGRLLVRTLHQPIEVQALGALELYDYIERAIKAARDFHRDQKYVVRDGEIVIVDESTGRLAEGRKWRDGIHQAIEAQEGVEITIETGTAARVTMQDFFSNYDHVGGMSGTVSTAAAELRKIYKLAVEKIPTNKPVARRELSVSIHGTSDQKWSAVVAEVCQLHEQGRPVLIGTRSIDKSEHLSQLLAQAGIDHQLLNARHVAEEAEIVAHAGQRGKVTVSTNMAGRGTDIKLGEGVSELGGLHVIATEMHESVRIDNQLKGRCGRQGDPGTFRQYLAMDDEILKIAMGPKKASRLKKRGENLTGVTTGFSPFRTAQQRITRKHFRDRAAMLYFHREKKKTHKQMGLDPYLDVAE